MQFFCNTYRTQQTGMIKTEPRKPTNDSNLTFIFKAKMNTFRTQGTMKQNQNKCTENIRKQVPEYH